MAKVQDETEFQPGDLQIIEHLANFVVRDLLDHFRLHNNLSKDDQVRHILSYFDAFIDDIESWLLLVGNALLLKFHDQGIFIRFFQ